MEAEAVEVAGDIGINIKLAPILAQRSAPATIPRQQRKTPAVTAGVG